MPTRRNAEGQNADSYCPILVGLPNTWVKRSYTWPFDPVRIRPLKYCQINDVARWFLENGLLLNPDKTEAVLFSILAQRKKIPTAGGIDVMGVVVPFRDTVKLLGVMLDSALSISRHVTEVIRSCSYCICALCHIWPLLTLDVAKSVGHSIISTRLRKCTAHGISTSNLHRLQVAQNSLARAVCQAPRSVSATELCRQLHWLPVRQRISYKLAVITYKTNLTKAPAYLSDIIHEYHPTRTAICW